MLGSLTGTVFGSAKLGSLGVERKSTKLGSLTNVANGVLEGKQADLGKSGPVAMGNFLDDLLVDPFSTKNLLVLGLGGFLVWKFVLRRKRR